MTSGTCILCPKSNPASDSRLMNCSAACSIRAKKFTFQMGPLAAQRMDGGGAIVS